MSVEILPSDPSALRQRERRVIKDSLYLERLFEEQGGNGPQMPRQMFAHNIVEVIHETVVRTEEDVIHA